MNFLPELGLQDLCDDDFFTKVIVPYAIEKGSVFNGYYGKYIWNSYTNTIFRLVTSNTKPNDKYTYTTKSTN